MARCEDFPACGHELGCCPDFDENGKQLNMICTCGAVLPPDNPYSICNACLYRSDPDDEPLAYQEYMAGQFDDEEE